MLSGVILGVRCARRFVPRLESLESRDCPAAPVISSFTATQVAGQQVLLSGTVSDEAPAGVTVSFTGAASGSALVNSAGQFSVTLSLGAISVIHAQALDGESLLSAVVDETPANDGPVITDFFGEQIGGPGNLWTFSGYVDDESPEGLTVVLGGIPSLENVTVTVDETGWFSITVSLGADEGGTATADVTDWYGVAATTALTLVRQI